MLLGKDSYYLAEMSSADIQGDVGEIVTASTLRSSCSMQVLRNVYLPVGSYFTEIDLIALSPLGVFVIENKNYSGTVKGSISDKYWKVNYGMFKCERLLNPIIQNSFHKNKVRELLIENGFKDINIFQPVIFNEKAVLDIVGCDKYVFSLSKFVKLYKEVEYKESISNETISDLYKFFSRFSDGSAEMRSLHKYLLKLRS